MPAYTTNFSELLEPGLRTVFDQNDRAWPEEWSKIFEKVATSKYQEHDFFTSGFGVAPVKAEGDSISYDNVYRGFKKTYTQVVYGLGFTVTREMYEFDQYRHMNQKPKALARSMNETVEILCANILNNAFTSGTGADAKYLCATDHPTATGGTWTNSMSAAADLSITSFEAALIAIGAFVDHRGLKFRAIPQRLIVSTSEAFTAEIILKSAGLPETPNNDMNPAKGILPQGHVVNHYLTDADAWFIQTDAPNGLLTFWSRNKEFGKDNDFDSDNAKFKSTMALAVGWTDPRCIYGSAGA
jgi:hypothetical protein